MNKSELIRVLAAESNLTVEESDFVVKTFFDSMRGTLLTGGRVEIRGFGSFKMKAYKGYAGRNPKTGEAVVVASKRLPFFRAGKELREMLNKG